MNDCTLRIQQILRLHERELFVRKGIGTFRGVDDERLIERVVDEKELRRGSESGASGRLAGWRHVDDVDYVLAIELRCTIEPAVQIQVTNQPVNAGSRVRFHRR